MIRQKKRSSDCSNLCSSGGEEVFVQKSEELKEEETWGGGGWSTWASVQHLLGFSGPFSRLITCSILDTELQIWNKPDHFWTQIRLSSYLHHVLTPALTAAPSVVRPQSPTPPLFYSASLSSRRHGDRYKQLSLPWLWHPGRRGLARRPRPANDQWRCGVCGFSQRRQRNAGLLEKKPQLFSQSTRPTWSRTDGLRASRYTSSLQVSPGI